jgi:hypothetical protein
MTDKPIGIIPVWVVYHNGEIARGLRLDGPDYHMSGTDQTGCTVVQQTVYHPNWAPIVTSFTRKDEARAHAIANLKKQLASREDDISRAERGMTAQYDEMTARLAKLESEG